MGHWNPAHVSRGVVVYAAGSGGDHDVVLGDDEGLAVHVGVQHLSLSIEEQACGSLHN